MKSFLTLITLLFSINIFSANDLEKPAGKFTCHYEAKRCEYVVQNLSNASSLITKIKAIMFPPASGSIIHHAGRLNAETTDLVVWWWNDMKKAEDCNKNCVYTSDNQRWFTSLLGMVDTLEKFRGKPQVELTAEIYSISDAGLDELGFNFSAKKAKSDDSGKDIDISIGSFQISSSIITDTLTGFLSLQRVRNQIERITVATAIATNGQYFSRDETEDIYISPTDFASEAVILSIGTKFSGAVSISSYNNNIVRVKHGELYYGMPVSVQEGETPRVKKIKIPINIEIEEGYSRLLTSSYTTETIDGSDVAIFGAESSSEKKQNKLIIILRVKTLSWAQLKANALQTVQKISFTKEEIDAFGKKELPLKDVFKSGFFKAKRMVSGEQGLSFRLDQKMAHRENIKKRVTVTIEGGGLKIKKTRTLEQLMLRGVRFNARFKPDYFSKDIIKFEVEVKEYEMNSDNHDYWSDEEDINFFSQNFGLIKSELAFEYLPETNEIYKKR